jgi:tetratricopeptide (TPR) repeat protein
MIGNPDKALEEFSRAIELNPNGWKAYRGLGNYYINYDLVKSVESYSRAISLHKGPFYPNLLKSLGNALADAGFLDEGLEYFDEALKLDDDYKSYYAFSAWISTLEVEFEKALNYAEKVYALDTTDIYNHFRLGGIYLKLGKKQESLRYYESWIENANRESHQFRTSLFRIALAYWENGLFEEAKYYFDQQELHMQKEKELGRLHEQLLYNYHDLAAIQALKGEKEKALENLKIFSAKQSIPYYVPAFIEIEPFFDKLRDDPEFQAIFQEIEAKHLACHERVRVWMEENDML